MGRVDRDQAVGFAPVLVKGDQQRIWPTISFALEGDPRDYDTDAEALTLDVNVAPAA